MQGDLNFVPPLRDLENDSSHLRVEVILNLVISSNTIMEYGETRKKLTFP